MPERPDHETLDDEWYSFTREATRRLVGIRSVSPGSGETEAAREVLRLLYEGGLADAYTLNGLDPLEGDAYGRHNAYAFLRGASRRTVILFGHLDTVDTADYGVLEPWALDPAGLATRQGALLEQSPQAMDDLLSHPGDWMFGRGVADMKSGVAAAITVLRHLARQAPQDRPPLSVLLLATVDEENESAGMLRGVRLLQHLRERHDVDYVGAINTDYTTAHYSADPHRYIYSGTIGKLLAGFFVVGCSAHAGAPFDGLDANLLAAELVRDLSLNMDLCDTLGRQTTPPPVTLRAGDLKGRYDTQLAIASYVLLNVLTLTTTPKELLARLRPRAEAALARVLARVDRMERRWTGAGAGRGAGRHGAVLTYADLRAETELALGRELVEAELAAEWERWPATLDKRERCLRLIQRLWSLSGRAGPVVVLFYAPPYYPHIAPAESALSKAVRGVIAVHPEHHLADGGYFPLLCDMSYLQPGSEHGLAALRDNMPVWQDAEEPPRRGGYRLPLAAMRALNVPVVNIGPYGRGVHQRDERVLMSYSFGVAPRLIYEVIERLAHGRG